MTGRPKLPLPLVRVAIRCGSPDCDCGRPWSYSQPLAYAKSVEICQVLRGTDLDVDVVPDGEWVRRLVADSPDRQFDATIVPLPSAHVVCVADQSSGAVYAFEDCCGPGSLAAGWTPTQEDCYAAGAALPLACQATDVEVHEPTLFERVLEWWRRVRAWLAGMQAALVRDELRGTQD